MQYASMMMQYIKIARRRHFSSKTCWLNEHAVLKYEHHSCDPLSRLAAFESWLKAQGACFDDVALSKNDRGFAAYATSRIPAQRQAISIPFKLLISASAAAETPIGCIAQKSGVDSYDGNLFLSLALLNMWADQAEVGKEVMHGPYLDILPRRLSHMPFFWSASELSLMEGSPMLDEVAYYLFSMHLYILGRACF